MFKTENKGVAEEPLDKKILGVTHGFNQPSQQKTGIEMRLLTGGTKGNRKNATD